MSNSVIIPSGSVDELLTGLQSILGGEVEDDVLWLNTEHDVGIYDNFKSPNHTLSLKKADGRVSALPVSVSSNSDIYCVYDKSKSGNTVMFGFSNAGIYGNYTIVVTRTDDKIAVYSGDSSLIRTFYIYNAKADSGISMANSNARCAVFINAFSDDIGAATPEVYMLRSAPASQSSLNNTKWLINDKTVVVSCGIGIAID